MMERKWGVGVAVAVEFQALRPLRLRYRYRDSGLCGHRKHWGSGGGVEYIPQR
jgi:hypothetical protein